jgi:hypothetical protein
MKMANENAVNIPLNALPCLGRFISTSITSWALSAVMILCMTQFGVHLSICVAVGAILLALNIALTVNFIKNLNSKVTVTESGISQQQYAKQITIAYDAITDVTVKFSPLVKNPPLVTVFCGDDKISFDTTSKVYTAFRERCHNEVATDMLRRALTKHFIYD